MVSGDKERVNRVLAGMSDKIEAEQVAHWLATDEGQVYLSARIEEEFHTVADSDELFGSLDVPSDKMYHSIHKNIYSVHLRRKVMKGAAFLLPVAACLAFLLYINMRVDLLGASDYQDIYVAKGEQLQVAFQDGTRVYLYPDSHLRYPLKFSLAERKVFLEGEGYFVVSKNPNRPFVVDLGKASVHVTGTSFLVKAYAAQQDILVELDEGKVQLLYGKQVYPLNPGEELLFNKADNTCSINRHEGESALTRWKDKSIRFNNASLQEVLRALNLNYGTPFTVEDTAAYRYQYTFLVKRTSLDEVLKMMEIISPINFMLGDTVKVSLKHE